MNDNSEAGTVPLLTIEGHRATLRLNRPKKLNRLEPADLVSIIESLDAIEADTNIRVMVLTGTGRAFSTGFDLNAISARAHGSAKAPQMDVSFETMTNRVEGLRVPTICRLNGGVYGGSTDLALACDFRIGIDTAEMFMPAGRLGLHYYRSGMERYVSRLGINAAKKLFLTAHKIGAEELTRIGYLDEILPAAELDARIDALAAQIAANAPNALAAMKRSLNEISRGGHDKAAIDARHQESLRSAELKEGAAAFADKRPAKF